MVSGAKWPPNNFPRKVHSFYYFGAQAFVQNSAKSVLFRGKRKEEQQSKAFSLERVHSFTILERKPLSKIVKKVYPFEENAKKNNNQTLFSWKGTLFYYFGAQAFVQNSGNSSPFRGKRKEQQQSNAFYRKGTLFLLFWSASLCPK